MVTLPAALGGLLLGAGGVWLLREREMRWLREELRIAQDRLLHAWRDDRAVIPPRPIDVVPEEPLPPELQAAVEEWESAESRATQTARFRAALAQGRGVPAILLDEENRHP